MISRTKRGIVSLIAALTLLTCNAVSVGASAYETVPQASTSLTVQAAVPNNTPDEYNNATGKGNNKNNGGGGGTGEAIDATDILGSGQVGRDDTGYAEQANSWLQVGAKFIINLAVYLFATFLLVMFAVDCVCIPFPPIAKLFATKVPIQLFSNEVAGITGMQYSYTKGGGPGGGASAPPPAAGGANGQEGVGAKYIRYFKERAIALIFSGALLVMTYSGLLSKLLNTVINLIVNFFNK